LCNRMIGSLRPLVLLPGIHCAPWLVMNGNMNYSRRSEELQELRADERPNLEAATVWIGVFSSMQKVGIFYFRVL
jgi:hypothetical protein